MLWADVMCDMGWCVTSDIRDRSKPSDWRRERRMNRRWHCSGSSWLRGPRRASQFVFGLWPRSTIYTIVWCELWSKLCCSVSWLKCALWGISIPSYAVSVVWRGRSLCYGINDLTVTRGCFLLFPLPFWIRYTLHPHTVYNMHVITVACVNFSLFVCECACWSGVSHLMSWKRSNDVQNIQPLFVSKIVKCIYFVGSCHFYHFRNCICRNG